MTGFNDTVTFYAENGEKSTGPLREFGGYGFSDARDAYPEDGSASLDPFEEDNFEGGEGSNYFDANTSLGGEEGGFFSFSPSASPSASNVSMNDDSLKPEVLQGIRDKAFFNSMMEENLARADSLPSLGLSDTSSQQSSGRSLQKEGSAEANPEVSMGKDMAAGAAVQGGFLGLPYLFRKVMELINKSDDDDNAATNVANQAPTDARANLMMQSHAAESSQRGAALVLQ